MASLTAASPGLARSVGGNPVLAERVPSLPEYALSLSMRSTNTLSMRSTNKMPSANAEGKTAGQSPIALEYAEEYSRIRQRTAFAAAVARRSGP
ncbi:MAG: hypothetical protein QOF66_4052 [Mycobacterium sp.]|jgi:hypothetical protein|nr:hypothetical protein [Mycobacterium sp.]MDT5055686.1 hypothetical protein [Mycobacterium sp.]